jgi:hypothetical protein
MTDKSTRRKVVRAGAELVDGVPLPVLDDSVAFAALPLSCVVAMPLAAAVVTAVAPRTLVWSASSAQSGHLWTPQLMPTALFDMRHDGMHAE